MYSSTKLVFFAVIAVCVTPGMVYGMPKTLQGVGGPCKTDGECYFGSYCLDGKCANYSAAGKPCGGKVRCAPYMTCGAGGAGGQAGGQAPADESDDGGMMNLVRRNGEGTCQYKFPEEGKACTFPKDCGGAGFFCSTLKVCIKNIPAGGACDNEGCEGDNRCLVGGGARDGKCVPRLIQPGGVCGLKYDWAPMCASKRDANGAIIATSYCAFPDGQIDLSSAGETMMGVCKTYADHGQPCNGPEHIRCSKKSQFKVWETQCSTDIDASVKGPNGKEHKPLGKCIKVTKMRLGQECCPNCLPCEDTLKCKGGFHNEWNFPISKCLKP